MYMPGRLQPPPAFQHGDVGRTVFMGLFSATRETPWVSRAPAGSRNTAEGSLERLGAARERLRGLAVPAAPVGALYALSFLFYRGKG